MSEPASGLHYTTPVSQKVFKENKFAWEEGAGTETFQCINYVKDVPEELCPSAESSSALSVNDVTVRVVPEALSLCAIKSRLYRQRLQRDPERYSQYRHRENQRIKKSRQNRSEEQKAIQRQKALEWNRRLREIKKSRGPCACSVHRTQSQTGVEYKHSLTGEEREPQTRAECDCDKRRQRDRERKRRYRASLPSDTRLAIYRREREKKAARKAHHQIPGHRPTPNTEPITAAAEQKDCPMSGYESEGMESHDSQLTSEVKIEVDMADEMAHDWMTTHHMQNPHPESDDELNQPAVVPIRRISSPSAIREEAARIARAFYAYKAKVSLRTDNEESDGGGEILPRRPGRPWTHSALKVVCLDIRRRGFLGRAPSVREMAALTSRGLGIPVEANDRGVSHFKNSDSASKFHQCLQQYFPRLIPGEYCFGASTKGQHLAEIPNCQVLTVQAVKRILNQGRLYIIPFALRDMDQTLEQSPQVVSGLPPVRDCTFQDGSDPGLPHFQVFPEPSPVDEENDFNLQDSTLQMVEEAALQIAQEAGLQTSPEVVFQANAESAPQSVSEPVFRTDLRSVPANSGSTFQTNCGPTLQMNSGSFLQTSPDLLTNSSSAVQANLGHILRSRASVAGAVSDCEHRTPTLPPASVLENKSFADLVLELRPTPPDNRKILLNIKKDNFLCDARRGFFRKGVDLRRPTSVKFVGMPDVDTGALSAQFRAELVRHIRDSDIFAGPDDSKMLVFSIQCVQDELYRQCGAMLAYVIAHGGPYPEFFSDKLYSLLLGEHVDFTIHDIPSPSIRTRVEQVQAAETEEECAAAVKHIDDLLLVMGLKPSMLQARQTLVDHIVRFMCCDLLEKPLRQLRDGLRQLGVMDLVERNCDSACQFFLPHLQPHVNVETLRDLWTCDIDGTSHSGQEEIRIHGYFLDLLLDLEENQLKQLLKFSTGRDSIPAEGFHRPPRLTFNHQESIPTANTDTLELCLPVTPSVETFNAALLSVLETVTCDFLQA